MCWCECDLCSLCVWVYECSGVCACVCVSVCQPVTSWLSCYRLWQTRSRLRRINLPSRELKLLWLFTFFGFFFFRFGTFALTFSNIRWEQVKNSSDPRGPETLVHSGLYCCPWLGGCSDKKWGQKIVFYCSNTDKKHWSHNDDLKANYCC